MNTPQTRAAPKRSSFFIWFGLIWLLLSSIFIFVGWKMLQLDQRYDREGVAANAKILGKRVDEKYNSKEKRTERSYYIKYEFSVPNGQTLTNESGVSRDRYDSATTGNDVGIQYLPTEPETNRIADGSSYIGDYLMMGFGGLGCLIGLVSLGFEFRARSRRARLMQDGILTDAVVDAIRPGSMTVNNVEQLQIHYTYNDNSGRVQQGESEHMSPEIARQWEPGSKGKIRFNREKPTESIWIG